MPDLEHGFSRAVIVTLTGVMILLSVNTIIHGGLLDPSWAFYFRILAALSSIGLILAMPYWGSAYLVGWLLGQIVMAQANLVSFADLLIFVGIPLLILIARIYRSSD